MEQHLNNAWLVWKLSISKFCFNFFEIITKNIISNTTDNHSNSREKTLLWLGKVNWGFQKGILTTLCRMWPSGNSRVSLPSLFIVLMEWRTFGLHGILCNVPCIFTQDIHEIPKLPRTLRANGAKYLCMPCHLPGRQSYRTRYTFFANNIVITVTCVPSWVQVLFLIHQWKRGVLFLSLTLIMSHVKSSLCLLQQN